MVCKVTWSNFSGEIHNLPISFNMDLKCTKSEPYRSLSKTILLFHDFLDEMKGLWKTKSFNSAFLESFYGQAIVDSAIRFWQFFLPFLSGKIIWVTSIFYL